MSEHKLFSMPFSTLYSLYLAKIRKKNRDQSDLDGIILWLLGYSKEELDHQLINQVTVRDFFDQAPSVNEKASAIKGMICGVKIEEVADPLMKKIRVLDKLIDELAKGKPIDKMLLK